MYAIIEEGGKQFKVTGGDVIRLDRPYDEKGAKKITFDRVLLVAGDGKSKIGAPLVSGASITAEVLGPAKGPKIDIQKYKRRKGYSRTWGHRQKYTEVKINEIKM